MNIDGHAVRASRIDAVTEIEIEIKGAHEGTDKFARGGFKVLVNGYELRIARVKRFNSYRDETAQDAAIKIVRDELTAIRDSAVAAMGEGG